MTKLLFDIGRIFNKTLFDHSCREVFLKEKELRYRAVLRPTEICLILLYNRLAVLTGG